MASSNNYQTPDLATVLATLANLRPPDTTQQNAPQTSQSQTAPWSATQPEQSYQHQQWRSPVMSTPSPAPAVAKNLVDPATIVDWPSGLRCIMKTVTKHESLLGDVRKMMKSQHEHEEQWWKAREELIKKQKAREEGQKMLDDVLKSVGGTASTGTSSSDPEEMAKELKTFDMKVYRAQLQMFREMTTRLKNLGVPFFGTKSDLVIPKGKDEVKPGDGGKKLEKGMIKEVDLLELQKKMMSMLEDLIKE